MVVLMQATVVVVWLLRIPRLLFFGGALLNLIAYKQLRYQRVVMILNTYGENYDAHTLVTPAFR